MAGRIFVKRHIEFLRCPQCNSIATLKKSRSGNTFNRILKALKVRVYFCSSCGYRHRYFLYKLSRNGLKIIILYTAAVVFTAVFVNFFLRTFFK